MRKQEIFIFYQYEENHGSPQLSLLVTEGNICLWIYICAQNEKSVSLSRCNDRIFWKIVSHRFLGNSIAYEENGNFSFAFKFDWYLQSKKVFVFIVYNSIVVNTYTLRILAPNLINETTFPIYAFLDTEEKNGIELFCFFLTLCESYCTTDYKTIEGWLCVQKHLEAEARKKIEGMNFELTQLM